MAEIPGLLSVLSFVLSFAGCWSWEFCRSSSYYSYNYYIYCEYGCCGSYKNQHCCENKVGLIVGAVFGGLVLLAFLIGAVICCLQQKGKKGTVVRPLGTTGHTTNMSTVAYINTGDPRTIMQPPPYTAAPPPEYSQFSVYSPQNHHPPPQGFPQSFTPAPPYSALPPSHSALPYPPVSSASNNPPAASAPYPPIQSQNNSVGS